MLNISGNKIGDGGIGVLCKKLRRNQHLETLDLAHNDLHEGAAEDLADMLALNASLTSVFKNTNQNIKNNISKNIKSPLMLANN